jgi:hypothetical protein
VAESIVVDQFLAKRFNLLGDNEYEEMAIKGHYSNIHFLRGRFTMAVTWTYPEKRKQALETFLTQTLPRFIEDHEFHLKANGGNGHYVGNKVYIESLSSRIAGSKRARISFQLTLVAILLRLK